MKIVRDLILTAFVTIFKGFVAGRGLMAHIYSRKDSNFNGASKVNTLGLSER